MAKILSNTEIDSLFEEVSKGGSPTAVTSTPSSKPESKLLTSQRNVNAFDFTKPSRFRPQQIKSLWRLHELAAGRMQSSLSSVLRLGARVELMDLEQTRFDSLVDALPAPSVVGLLDTSPLRYGGLIVMECGLALRMIDRLLGGTGSSLEGPERKLTPLELVILDSLFDVILSDLEEAWSKVAPVKLKITDHESNPEYARIIPPKEVVAVVTLGIGGELDFGEVRLCLPHLGLEPYLGQLEGMRELTSSDEVTEGSPKLQAACVEAAAVLGRARVPVQDLLDLAVGDIIPLDRGIGGDVELEISGQTKFTGRVVSNDGVLSLMIDSAVDSTLG